MQRPSTIEPFSKQVTIIVGLTVVGFMAFGLTLSFYRNVLFEETLKELALQNDEIAKDIGKGYRELEYYQSDQYKDKFAKENLHRINPGEKVLIITQQPPGLQPLLETSKQEQERKEAAYLELLRQMPTLEHWRLYLFNRERVSELKRGL